MLQNWFILLPEILILLFFPIAALIEWAFREKNSKTYFMLAQFCLGMSASFAILFYNKSAFPEMLQKTPLSTLFTTTSALMALEWFYLSSKWYINKNQPSFKFYALCLAVLFGLNIITAASSMITLSIGSAWVCFFTCFLIVRDWNFDKIRASSRSYAGSAFFFMLLLWSATAIFYWKVGSFSYIEIGEFIAKNTKDHYCIAASLMIIAAVMFMLAQVPFHQWFPSVISEGHLPVSGFLVLVPPLLYVCALINLVKGCFMPLSNIVFPVITVFAVASLVVGALSMHHENNMRKWAAYISIYCLGFALIGLSDFSKASIIASFAYLMVTVLSLSGIYTVFLGMKSKGDYIRDVTLVNGFYETRPYMSAALLVFIFSLIGLAPTLGFFGYLSVVNNLIVQDAWVKIFVLLITLLFVAGAGLQLIRAIYFEPQSNKYDRPDKAIYICLFISMLLILASLLNPTWIMHDILIILGGLS